MTRPFIALLLLFAFAPTAHAQLASADARFSVGIAVDRLFTLDSDATDAWGFSPEVRVGANRSGWGPMIGLGWFETNVTADAGLGEFTTVTVRPVMAGIGYTLRRGPWSYEIGVAAGWTFNSAKALPAAEQYFSGTGGGPVEAEVSNSLAVGPRLRVYYDTPSRIAFTGTLGLVLLDPEVTLRSGGRSITIDRNLSSVTVEAGIVFALF